MHLRAAPGTPSAAEGVELFDSVGFRGEKLVLARDHECGLSAVIAIDDTRRGRALGGIRMAPYPTWEAGAREACRLAASMTRKNAIAEIAYGGAKAVVFEHPDISDRQALMRALGRVIADTRDYIPGVDMGTNADDLAIIASCGAKVSCVTADPSPYTASGVSAAIRAAVAHKLDRAGLEQITVLIQGVGRVGADLAWRLRAQGATVLVADTDEARAEAVADEFGCVVVDAADVVGTTCDVFAPCAKSGVLSAETVPLLDTKIIAGAANDVLASPEVAGLFAPRDIAYVPDFVANGGGVIQIDALERGLGDAATMDAVDRIGERVDEILAEAAARSITTVAAAEERVARLLERASRC